MKKIKLPRKRKKIFKKHNPNKGDYQLSKMANEVCMEMDDKNRGFKFHSKFIKKMDRRGNILSTY